MLGGFFVDFPVQVLSINKYVDLLVQGPMITISILLPLRRHLVMPGLMCLCVFSFILNLHVLNFVYVCYTHTVASVFLWRPENN